MEHFVIELMIDELARGPLFIFIFLFYVVLYPVAMIILNIGFTKSPYKAKKIISDKDLPIVSVLLCAKNEEKNISETIEALLKLDYPREKTHFIIVNDDSTDSTGSLIEKYAKLDARILMMNTGDMPASPLIAKARAIDWGMTQTKGEWVFFTDADTIVAPSWLRSMLQNAGDETGIIGGPLTVKDQGTLVSRIEKSVWAYVQMYSIGMSGIGKTFTTNGPNMAIRKSIYEQTGGLPSLGNVLADDLAIYKLCVIANREVVYTTNPAALLVMKPLNSYYKLLYQSRRWLKGGVVHEKKYRLFLGMVFSYATFFGLFMVFGWLISIPLFAMFWISKIIVDMVYIYLQKKRLGVSQLLQNYLFFQVHKTIVLITMPISLVINKSITWKGKTYY